MKNKSFFASVAGLAVLFLVNACQKPAMEEPSIMLSLSSVPVTAEGGDFDVAFKVSNPPADNGAVTAELADPNAAEWVTGLTVNEEKSTVEFHVEPSKTPEQRTAEVTVSCAGAEDASFTIVQEPGVPDPFTFTLKDKSFKSVTFDLIPEDKDMYYFTAFTTQSYLDAYGLTTDEALYQDDIDYCGSNFGNYLGQGDQTDITYDAGIIPATDYVAYVYGVDPDSYERLTDIVYLKVTTDQVELVDVDFSIDVVKDGAGFTFSVDPGTYDGYWNALCVETASLDPEVSLFELVSSAWNNQAAAYLSYGYEPEVILEQLCLKGANGSLSFQNIKPETAYTVIVFAVNSDAFASSEPAVVEVTTGAVSASDNEIEVSVDRVSGSTAMLHIATSNDDPYGFMILDAVSVDGMSDEEILAELIAGNEFYTNEGPLDTKFTGMEPEHSYKAVAFGYEAGEATTGLSSCDFTTTAGVSGSIDFELRFDDYYDIAATADALTAAGYAEDGKYVASLAADADCLMPVTPVTDPEVGTFYYVILSDVPGNHADDDTYLSFLMSSGNSMDATYYRLPYDSPMFAIGVAFDDFGQPGPVWKSDSFTLTEDGVSDPQGFVDYLYPHLKSASALRAGTPKAAAAIGSIDASPEAEHFAPVAIERQPAVYNGGEAVISYLPARGNLAGTDAMQLEAGKTGRLVRK